MGGGGGESFQVCRCQSRAKEIVITPAEKRAARHQLSWQKGLRLSLRKREDDEQQLPGGEERARCSGGGLCQKDDVRGGIKKSWWRGGRGGGCNLEATFREKDKDGEKDGTREIQI